MHALFRGLLLILIPPMLLCCSSAYVLAAELEVDNVRGSDSQQAGTKLLTRPPYRTIQRAIDHASIGDTITIRKNEVPYRECVSINTRILGSPFFPLVIEGNGATLDGTRILGLIDWTALGRDLFELNVRSPGYIKILAAGDQPVPENLGQVANLSSLQPFQYGRNTGAIYFRTRRGDIPQVYGLRVSVEQTGLTLYEVNSVVIRNLNISGYRLDGINCHDLVSDVRFENVVSENNGRSGISVGGASQVQYQGGKLRSNGDSQARSEGQGKLELIGVAIEPGKAKSIDQAGGQIVERQ